MKSLPLLLSLPLLFTALPALSDSAESFGRAQTDKNSYEAQREWRQRNSSSVQLQQVILPQPDGRPRSSDEVQAEHEQKMKAMLGKWDDGRTAQQMSDDRDRADADAVNQWVRDEYPKFIRKARKLVLKGEDKWQSFLAELDRNERNYLESGSVVVRDSPMADFGYELYAGDGKHPGETEKALLVWKRGSGIDDMWSAYALGMYEEGKGTPEGLAQALQYYQECYTRKTTMFSARNACRLKVIRAHAFGLGTPVNPGYAAELLKRMSQDEERLFNPRRSLRSKPWADAIMLDALMNRLGIGMPRNEDYARNLLRTAVLPESPDSWRLLTALLRAGGDIEDKAVSWNLLKQAYVAGHTEVGGEMALKLLAGEGVPADVDGAYALAMSQAGLDPAVTARLARGLMAAAPAKAVALLDRHALPEDGELQAMLTEARAAAR